MTPSFDALIIGGGPAGATSALLLAKAGWSVAILEKSAFPRGKVCGEFLSATNFPLLDRIGLSESFFAFAGPPVRQVGFFSGDHAITAEMPGTRAQDAAPNGWGRALGRDCLDTLLLQRAASAGVTVFQPFTAVRITKQEVGAYLCEAACRETGQSCRLRTRIVIAAHGSWEPGTLLTQPPRPPARPSDLFGFKAHFLGSRLPSGLMPLLAFPGGYGGMVHSDRGRVSLSCCIRRDRLDQVRRAAGAVKAGEAVFAQILRACRAAREVLHGAALDGDWFSAGPIRPGVRSRGFEGIFAVGNAAGEAHPVIAEGIGMAMQSSWLLCERLIAAQDRLRSLASFATFADALGEVRADYAAAWRRSLAPRIYAAAAIAHWAMRPAAVACSLPALRLFPRILTVGAGLSGKAVAVGVQSIADHPLTTEPR